MSDIFSDKQIRKIWIPNRMVLPPLVTFNFSENGYVNERKLEHYQAIAKSGIGLIVVEATAINPNGRLSDDQLGIWGDQFLPGLTQLAKTIHDEGVKTVIQIHHAGAKTKVTGLDEIVSSSDYKHARAMSLEEIISTIDDFKQAAIRAEKAGFDGVEIHGAHGYLLTQFFSKTSNMRSDQYGGSYENRIRIAKDIIEHIRAITGDDFIVGIRMGCNENSLEESKQMARSFESFGYDYLSVSTGLDAREINKPESFNYHWIVYGGTEIKKVVNIPVIGVYKIKTEDQIRGLIQTDLLDFVALGRAQLADYRFTEKIKTGEEILYCLDCKPCQWRFDGKNCPQQIKANRKKIK